MTYTAFASGQNVQSADFSAIGKFILELMFRYHDMDQPYHVASPVRRFGSNGRLIVPNQENDAFYATFPCL
jgi:hypothetical protein